MSITTFSCRIRAMEFGERLLLALEKSGMNQSQLARRLGIKPQSVQKWAYGETTPRYSRISQIAEALGVSAAWLATGEGDPWTLKTEVKDNQAGYNTEMTFEERLIAIAKRIGPKERARMIRILEASIEEEEREKKKK